MFKLINSIVFLQIFAHFEVDACNTFQNSWNSGNKDYKSWGIAEKKPCLEYSTDEQVNWKQVSIVIGYKRNIPERLRFSQARIGSPLCEPLRGQTV